MAKDSVLLYRYRPCRPRSSEAPALQTYVKRDLPLGRPILLALLQHLQNLSTQGGSVDQVDSFLA